MKVRFKFSKQGELRFIGHLDVMRYFQKAMRRAGMDIRFSEGMSPHMIMSFALPLGVGQTSDCEYMDVELNTPISRGEALERLNSVMTDGIYVTDMIEAAEGKAGKAMSLVAAADYRIRLWNSSEADEDIRKNWLALLNGIDSFLAQSVIETEREGRDGPKTIDIRPLILDMHRESECLFMRLCAGSHANLKPGTALDCCLDFLHLSLPAHLLHINREEVYADEGTGGEHKFIPLGELGI